MAPNLRQKNKQELRQRLYDTALELFDAHGYEATTIRQITEQVGVAKGTFFNHFPTKEHVVQEWYNAITFTSLEAARERSAATAEQAIIDLCVDMAQRATATPELLLAKARHSTNPLLVEAERVQDVEIDAYTLDQVRAGKQRGELRPDLDEHFFVDLLGVMVTGSSRVWCQDPEACDFPEAIRDRLAFLFLAATSTRA